MNRVFLRGKLGQDPELRYTAGGLAMATLRVATDDGHKKDGVWVKETQWHTVLSWGKTAESAAKNLAKGSTVVVDGSIAYRTWEDKEGKTRYMTEIKADRLEYDFPKHVRQQELPVDEDQPVEHESGVPF